MFQYPALAQYLQQFEAFTPAQLQIIEACFKPRTYKKGSLMLRAGQPATQLAFIQKGVMRIYYYHEGRQYTRYLGAEPSFITSLTHFISQTPSQEYIEALENTEVLLISHENMLQLCRQIHAWETLYRKVIEHMFVCVENRIREFITLKAEQRYEVILAQLPWLFQRVPQKYIASYIGIKPQSLSRLMRKAVQSQKLTNVNNAF